jgi:hypothetical protein
LITSGQTLVVPIVIPMIVLVRPAVLDCPHHLHCLRIIPFLPSPVVMNTTTIPPQFPHKVEEYLLILLIENHFPKHMYAAIMEWAHYASFLDYDFASALTYQTVLMRMMKKYVHVSGGPPLSEIVCVPGHAPMHVYHFDFLKQVT